MVAKRTSRTSSAAAVHAGRPDSVRQRGRILWCRPNRARARRERRGTVVEVRTVSTQAILYTQQQHRQTMLHASSSFGCVVKVFCIDKCNR